MSQEVATPTPTAEQEVIYNLNDYFTKTSQRATGDWNVACNACYANGADRSSHRLPQCFFPPSPDMITHH